MEPHEKLTFNFDELDVRLSMPSSEKLIIYWEGRFSSQADPKGLVPFIEHASIRGSYKIPVIEMHFEKLRSVRSKMIGFIHVLIHNLLVGRELVKLCYDPHGFQNNMVRVIRMAIESSESSENIKIGRLELENVEAPSTEKF